jgi:hypothetical protein
MCASIRGAQCAGVPCARLNARPVRTASAERVWKRPFAKGEWALDSPPNFVLDELAFLCTPLRHVNSLPLVARTHLAVVANVRFAGHIYPPAAI